MAKKSRTVRDFMTEIPVTLERDDELGLADDLMGIGRVRHLPVVDEEGALVGIISQRDLFRGALARTLGYGEHAQQKIIDMLEVKDVMSTDVVTIDAGETLKKAAEIMMEKKIGSLPVMEEGELAGILTEGDFLYLAL